MKKNISESEFNKILSECIERRLNEAMQDENFRNFFKRVGSGIKNFGRGIANGNIAAKIGRGVGMANDLVGRGINRLSNGKVATGISQGLIGVKNWSDKQSEMFRSGYNDGKGDKEIRPNPNLANDNSEDIASQIENIKNELINKGCVLKKGYWYYGDSTAVKSGDKEISSLARNYYSLLRKNKK